MDSTRRARRIPAFLTGDEVRDFELMQIKVVAHMLHQSLARNGEYSFMSVFERIDGKIRNMSTMLHRFGIEPAEFAQQRLGTCFAASMRTCLSCPNGDICRDWLACAPNTVERIPEFCPNALRFEHVRTMMDSDRSVN